MTDAAFELLMPHPDEDEFFDAWQRTLRLRLQEQVRAAYEHARAEPSWISQGQAYGMSLYERLTREVSQPLEDDDV